METDDIRCWDRSVYRHRIRINYAFRSIFATPLNALRSGSHAVAPGASSAGNPGFEMLECATGIVMTSKNEPTQPRRSRFNRETYMKNASHFFFVFKIRMGSNSLRRNPLRCKCGGYEIPKKALIPSKRRGRAFRAAMEGGARGKVWRGKDRIPMQRDI